jgi:hypothetical protein
MAEEQLLRGRYQIVEGKAKSFGESFLEQYAQA